MDRLLVVRRLCYDRFYFVSLTVPAVLNPRCPINSPSLIVAAIALPPSLHFFKLDHVQLPPLVIESYRFYYRNAFAFWIILLPPIRYEDFVIH